jgi:DNA topoisomerase-2
MEGRKLRRDNNMAEDYLYEKNTKQVNYTDFINKELVQFSNCDNERSIPSLVDGFKPGQRKVLFSCIKRNLHKEIKVAQLAGSVAELSAYHHGEQSLMGTIVNLAQNFVGSNNINLLLPIGQFGTRLHGGKDAASSRYIFTSLSPLTRLLFNPKDDPLYSYLNDDGLKVEPEWYCPLIPMVLVNGAEGIGTGWSTKIPNYNPREIIENIKRLINKEEPKQMQPYYKNFRGKIERLDDIRVVTNGEVAIIGENTVEITELPIGVWTQAYKESVLEQFCHGQEKTPACIHDYKEYHTDTTVRFIVKFTPEQFQAANKTGLHKFFKLQKTLSLNSMVLFDHNGCLRRYESAIDIIKEFFDLRLKFYNKRKQYLDGTLTAESLKLDNIARFILEKIEGKIKVENLKKAEIVRILKERGYAPDPVAKWREKCVKEHGYDTDDVVPPDNDQEDVNQEATKKDYDYLLGMPIWNLTMEKKDEILRQQKEKGNELKSLREKTPEVLWLDDLAQFLVELEKFEAKEKEDEVATQAKTFKAANTGRGGGASAKNTKGCRAEYLPDPLGERVEPIIEVKSEPTVKVEKQVKKTDEANIVDIITGRLEEVRNMDDKQIIALAEKLLNPTKEKKATSGTAKGVKKEKIDAKVVSDIDEEENGDDGDTNKKSVFKKKDQPVKREPKQAKAKETGEPGTKKAANSLDNYFSLKKDKKKAVESSDEDIDSSIEELSDILLDSPDVDAPRVKRARKPISYKLDDDDESTKSTSKKDETESMDDFMVKSDSDADDDYDDDNVNKKPIKVTKAGKSKKVDESSETVKTVAKHDDDDDDENAKKVPAKKADDKKQSANKASKEKKPVAPKKAYADSDDDDDGLLDSSDDDYGSSKSKKKSNQKDTKKILEEKKPTKKDNEKKAAVVDKAPKKSDEKSKPKSSTEEKENKPLAIASIFKKAAASKEAAKPAAKKPKANNMDSDDDIVIANSSDEESKPIKKKKLMDKNTGDDVKNKKRKIANVIDDDDDLYAIDD